MPKRRATKQKNIKEEQPRRSSSVEMSDSAEDSSSNLGSPATDKSLATTPDTTDRKKAVHLRCERQRREAINSGYHTLKELLPTSLANLGCKTTNASILFRAADHIHQLQEQHQGQDSELRRLNAELAALQIIAAQYETLSTQNTPVGGEAEADEMSQAKLKIFCDSMDKLFESFNDQVDTTDYATLARTLLVWLESADCAQVFTDVAQQQSQ